MFLYQKNSTGLLFAVNNLEFVSFRFEILCGKLRYILRFIRRTAKYIQIDGTSGIRKMRRNQGCLDQLRHAKSCDAWIISKKYHLCFTIASHLNPLTQKFYKLADGIRILHEREIAFI